MGVGERTAVVDSPGCTETQFWNGAKGQMHTPRVLGKVDADHRERNTEVNNGLGEQGAECRARGGRLKSSLQPLPQACNTCRHAGMSALGWVCTPGLAKQGRPRMRMRLHHAGRRCAPPGPSRPPMASSSSSPSALNTSQLLGRSSGWCRQHFSMSARRPAGHVGPTSGSGGRAFSTATWKAMTAWRLVRHGFCRVTISHIIMPRLYTAGHITHNMRAGL